jgi:F-type H+/Na+-transporting ATPase subunit alpha
MAADPRAEAPDVLAREAAEIDSYTPRLRIREIGRVISIGDGIAWIDGLPSAAIDDVLIFDDGSRAMVVDLTGQLLGAVLLVQTDRLTAGTTAQRSGGALSVPVGDGLLGRVIDPLGSPLDGEPELIEHQRRAIEAPSPPIVARDFVHEPLYTGIKIIDTMIPIGRGQRQLLVGDEGLGRSSIAIDTVINQRNRDTPCVYVLIGQKRSTVVTTVATLREHGALDYTTVVVAEANSLPGLQHLAPFTGCALAEFWMQRGRDALVVYDDLSTHARTYRELALLLRRPPGREAYPGDIFSVHAKLLERSTCLNAAHGGGSITALPIIETMEGEIAAYIPTNLISITDGQIFLDHRLFVAGSRPAIDIGRSVSRIGGQAQHPRIKEEAGRMKLDYLQFLELEVFTQFGARLESSMELTIHRGRILREILKQARFAPASENFLVAWMVAFNDGLLNEMEPDAVSALLSRLEAAARDGGLTLASTRSEWSKAVARWVQDCAAAKGNHDATS